MKFIKNIIISVLGSYTSILFIDSVWIGLLICLSTFYTPNIGLAGIWGSFVAVVMSRIMGYDVWDSKKGILAFNSLLICMMLAYYIPYQFALSNIILYIVALTVASITAMLFYVFLNWFTYYWFKISSLSLSFSILGIIIWMFLEHKGLFVSTQHIIGTGQKFLSIPYFWEGYFRGLGSIFFMPSSTFGIIVAILLLIKTRIGFILTLSGWILCYILQTVTHNPMLNGISFHSYNVMLVFYIVGGVLLIPSLSSLIYATIAGILVFILSNTLPSFNQSLSTPVLAIPFNVVTIFLIFSLRLRIKNSNPVVNDGIPRIPETTYELYNSRFSRFSIAGTPQFLLPVQGEWVVSQGNRGAHTHREQWAYAWDFEIKDINDKKWRDTETNLSDYFCYGKPVFAAATGTVVNVYIGASDNSINEVNTSDNWGNYIVIAHGYGIYSLYAHLKKDSIRVQYGQIVNKAEVIGHVGNSGRSPVPHLHFQIQNGYEAGAKSLQSNFINYLVKKESNWLFVGNGNPGEDEVITAYAIENRMQSLLRLVPGQVTNFKVKTRNREYRESWSFELDLYGVYKAISSECTTMEYSFFNGVYNTLGLNCKRANALSTLALLLSRFPYSDNKNLEWHDTSVLSVVLNRLFTNALLIIQPFIKLVHVNSTSNYVETSNVIVITSFINLKVFGFIIKEWNGVIEIAKNNGIKSLRLYSQDVLLLEATACE